MVMERDVAADERAVVLFSRFPHAVEELLGVLATDVRRQHDRGKGRRRLPRHRRHVAERAPHRLASEGRGRGARRGVTADHKLVHGKQQLRRAHPHHRHVVARTDRDALRPRPVGVEDIPQQVELSHRAQSVRRWPSPSIAIQPPARAATE